ncbi:MAG: thioredoxin family protein [Leadbetterella sp.]
MLKSILFLVLFVISNGWGTDFDQAKKQAKAQKKPILLNFSGSDWCKTCMNLKQKVLGTQEFLNYATTKLILVNADFPKDKINDHESAQMKKNWELIDTYNPSGSFPFTVLISSEGNVLKSWNGFPRSLTVATFQSEINSLISSK